MNGEFEPKVIGHMYGLFQYWTVPWEADGENLLSLHLDHDKAQECAVLARQANLHLDAEDFEVRVLPVYE